MEKKGYPSDLADKFLIRLPEGIRDAVKEIAKQNRRSMNAEIVCALEEKFLQMKESVNVGS